MEQTLKEQLFLKKDTTRNRNNLRTTSKFVRSGGGYSQMDILAAEQEKTALSEPCT